MLPLELTERSLWRDNEQRGGSLKTQWRKYLFPLGMDICVIPTKPLQISCSELLTRFMDFVVLRSCFYIDKSLNSYLRIRQKAEAEIHHLLKFQMT